MKKIIFLFVIFSDVLWEKAIKYVENGKYYIPEVMKVENLIMNADGEIKDKSSLIYKAKIESDKKIIYEIIKAFRNEKDITEQYLKDMKKFEKEKGKENYKFLGKDFDIFSPENKEKLDLRKIKIEKINNVDYFVYDFKLKNEREEKFGSAWIELETGKPLKFYLTQKPLPKYTKELKIFFYFREHEGSSVLEKMEIEGLGSFLFFKRKFKVTTIFENYFKFKN